MRPKKKAWTLEENERLKAQTIRMINHLKYRGIFGVEFKHCPADDKFYFIEISARAERFNGLARAAGLDLNLIAYQDAVGVDIVWAKRKRQHSGTWIDWGGCLSAFRRRKDLRIVGTLAANLFRGWESAVFAVDDLKPSLKCF